MGDQYANVTVAHQAHSDRRFELLGQLAGWSRWEALGRMVELWSRCTALQTDRPELDVIHIHLGPRGEQLLIDSRFGERCEDGLIRVRGGGMTGGDVDRFGWYEPHRQQQSEAGERRAKTAIRGPGGKFAPSPHGPAAPPATTSGTTSAGPAVTSGSPAVTSDHPASGFRIPDSGTDALSRAIPGPQQVPEPPQQPVPVPPPVLPTATAAAQEARRRLIGKAWDFARLAFHRVQAIGIDSTAPNGWAGMPGPDYPPMANLIAIVDSLIIGERPDFEAVQKRIEHRVLVAEAEARTKSTAQYMTPARIWNPDSFSIGVDMSIEQASTPRARAGPRGSAERASPRTGRVEPPPPSAFRRGVQKI